MTWGDNFLNKIEFIDKNIFIKLFYTSIQFSIIIFKWFSSFIIHVHVITLVHLINFNGCILSIFFYIYVYHVSHPEEHQVCLFLSKYSTFKPAFLVNNPKSYGLESKSVSSICQRIKYFSDLSI